MYKAYFSFLAVCCLLMACTQSAKAESYMPVSDIHRGMTGIGRTVFQGTRIDTFQVEILGVLKNVFGPKSDIILARLSGEPLEHTGVIAGMSGSPVYIDGKLIGAVGYSIGAFSKEPIAGITPIGEMMGILDRAPADTPFSTAERSPRNITSSDMPTALQPVALPLMFSGFVPEVIADFRDELTRYGLLPVQGGGGEDATLPSGLFEPGAPLGVQLIRGDLSITGIGTLTHRVGDRVVGFGHPMLFGGSTAMPMTAAYIHQVVSSQMLSFKLGSASQPMGVIVQDRAPGIAGVVGSDADMMPVRIQVNSPGKSETFRMEVFRSRELAPVLLRMALASSLISAEKLMGETTVNGGVTIYLPVRAPLFIEDVFAGPQGMGQAVLGLTQPLIQIMQNPFESTRIDSVAFQLSVEERIRSAQIKRMQLPQGRFEPGDTVRVSIVLFPVRGESQTVHLPIVLPKHMPKGRAMLRVMSERALLSQDAKRAPGAYQVEKLDDLVRLLEQVGRNDALVVELLSAQKSVTINGHEMSTLPESVLSALSLSRESGLVQQTQQAVLGRVRLSTNFVLTGTQTALISVGEEAEGVTFSERGPGGAGSTGGTGNTGGQGEQRP